MFATLLACTKLVHLYGSALIEKSFWLQSLSSQGFNLSSLEVNTTPAGSNLGLCIIKKKMNVEQFRNHLQLSTPFIYASIGWPVCLKLCVQPLNTVT